MRIVYVNADCGIPVFGDKGASVHIQDFGVCTDAQGNLVFECVGWAPADGYSSTGVLELILGHIYVLEIVDYSGDSVEVFYAKFGITRVDSQSVDIVWAYQTIEGLPELLAPDDPADQRLDPLVYEF